MQFHVLYLNQEMGLFLKDVLLQHWKRASPNAKKYTQIKVPTSAFVAKQNLQFEIFRCMVEE